MSLAPRKERKNSQFAFLLFIKSKRKITSFGMEKKIAGVEIELKSDIFKRGKSIKLRRFFIDLIRIND